MTRAVREPREHVELAPLTTFGVGGPARYLADVASEAELVSALEFARARGLEVTVLGGGSNVVIADEGVEGLVVRLVSPPRLPTDLTPNPLSFAGEGARIAGSGWSLPLSREGEGVGGGRSAGARVDVIDVFAGANWDAFVADAVARGLAGVECLSGIPGSVGATPIQNVGAYGQEVADTIRSVRAFDTHARAMTELDAAACGFGYRESAFKSRFPGRYVVTSVRFALKPGGAPALAYAELEKHVRAGVTSGSREPSLAEVRAAVLELRGRKAMLFDPGSPDGRSAGSFFTNPTVPDAEADRALEKLAQGGAVRANETPPRWPAGPGRTKLSAGWLIERSGLARGHGDGAVGLSTKHALAIVNRGGAKARDVVRFAASVRDRVLEKTGLALVPEPVLVGFDARDPDRRALVPG